MAAKKKKTMARGVGRKTVAKRGKIIGQQVWLNPLTNEKETFNVIEEGEADINFQKIWLGHILDMLDAVGNKKISVITYLLKHKDQNNQIVARQADIAAEVGCSTPIVNETIKLMKEANAIREQQRGVYVFNPDMIYKGSAKGRMNVILKYKDLNVSDEEAAADAKSIPAIREEFQKGISTTYKDLTTPDKAEKAKLSMLEDGTFINPATGEVFELDYQLTAERDGEIKK